MIDYQAIIAALDARYLEGFKALSETFAGHLSEIREKLAEDLSQAAGRIAQLEGEKAAMEKAIDSLIAELAKSQNALLESQQEMAARFDASQQHVRDAVEAALSALPIPKWVGVWDRTKDYQAGEFATWDGSMWHCNKACPAGEKPGGNEFWTLAVKRGQDLRPKEPEAA